MVATRVALSFFAGLLLKPAALILLKLLAKEVALLFERNKKLQQPHRPKG
jgi:hypothetical protein